MANEPPMPMPRKQRAITIMRKLDQDSKAQSAPVAAGKLPRWKNFNPEVKV